MKTADLDIEHFNQPLELAKALIGPDLDLGDGLSSKILMHLSDGMPMQAAVELILVQPPVKKLVALQKSLSDMKQGIIQAWADERMSRSQTRTSIQLLCLETA